MSKLQIGNPFFTLMGKLGDLVLLNLVWLVCCLPEGGQPVCSGGQRTLHLIGHAENAVYTGRHDLKHKPKERAVNMEYLSEKERVRRQVQETLSPRERLLHWWHYHWIYIAVLAAALLLVIYFAA